jgi:acylpyruvate hydrolase
MSHLSSALFTRTGPKILAIAKNYFDHAIEMGASSVPPHPILFQKPLTSVLPEGQRIKLPPGVEVHHEVELAFLIGRTGRHIPKSAADDYVVSFALALDLTARNLQNEAKKNSWPWDVGKGFDTFLPLSRFIDKSELGNPYDLELELKINGQTRQKGITGDMNYKMNDIIEYISKVMTLHAGDLILTGTPAGVGPVRPGDILESSLRRGPKVLLTSRFEAEA